MVYEGFPNDLHHQGLNRVHWLSGEDPIYSFLRFLPSCSCSLGRLLSEGLLEPPCCLASSKTSNEVQYDQRLFNQTKGMDSGFASGEDEIYNVYDQAWRGGKDMAQSIYRPSKNLDKDMYGDDLETRIKTNRFVPDKEFSGSDRRQRNREGPVQFEEDPFGLDKFLEEAKLKDF
ncbi:SNW domain-containing protein 1 [Microtus ochrogaster]|uniref:SNW domain-containing protein 1 n=1 Tax=Microtus ochrogaster TaxID=79684 RepID=A0A8J6GTV5_MICOH|nr:SNW domain-containing protein 1 [Microtus ochrogaster]